MLHWTYSNKWQRYFTLKKHGSTKPYLPETMIYNKDNLLTLLKKYPMIYLKPIVGSGGQGVIKIASEGEGYILHYYVKILKIINVEKLLKIVSSIVGKQPYLVQQGIKMISINNRPIDFRVLLLKPDKQWELIGIMGKHAAKNKCVTNSSQGGKALTLRYALSKTLNMLESETTQIEEKLLSLGLDTATALSKDYRYVREIGMDIAIDTDKKIWILETNSMPKYKLFKHHPDKKLYGRIDYKVRYIRRNYHNARLSKKNNR